MFDIITDSACDIVREYAETHNLKLVPLYTTFDGVNYLKEQYDITHDEFYRRMTDEGAFPKSSLPSVQDLLMLLCQVWKLADLLLYVQLHHTSQDLITQPAQLRTLY